VGEFQDAQKSVNPLSYIRSFIWHSLHACISLLHSTKQLVLTLIYNKLRHITGYQLHQPSLLQWIQ